MKLTNNDFTYDFNNFEALNSGLTRWVYRVQGRELVFVDIEWDTEDDTSWVATVRTPDRETISIPYTYPTFEAKVVPEMLKAARTYASSTGLLEAQ